MILIVFAALCLLSVPLLGGNLRRLADVHLRLSWLPLVALAVQVVITVIDTSGSPTAHRVVHIDTYAMLGLFLWANRRLPGVKIIGLGAFLNTLAIVANRGVMPASAWAQRTAGMHTTGAGFQNSAHLTHAALPWLGDIIPWPGPLPNVLSPGDCVIYAGTLVLVHGLCGRRAARHRITLTPLPD